MLTIEQRMHRLPPRKWSMEIMTVRGDDFVTFHPKRLDTFEQEPFLSIEAAVTWLEIQFDIHCPQCAAEK